MQHFIGINALVLSVINLTILLIGVLKILWTIINLRTPLILVWYALNLSIWVILLWTLSGIGPILTPAHLYFLDETIITLVDDIKCITC